jgi:hypothetical protein
MNRNPAGDTPAGPARGATSPASRCRRWRVLAVVAAATVAATALARRSAREPVPTRTIPAFDGIELSALQRTRVGLIQGRHAEEMRAIQEHMAPALSACAPPAVKETRPPAASRGSAWRATARRSRPSGQRCAPRSAKC